MLTVLLTGLLLLPSCAATIPVGAIEGSCPIPGDSRKAVLAKWGEPDHKMAIPIDGPLNGIIVQWTYPEKATYVYMLNGKVKSTKKMFK